MRALAKRFTAVVAAGIALCLFAEDPAFGTGYVITDLGTLGGTLSEATRINSNSQIVGGSWLSGGSFYHAFVDDGRVMRDLGTLCANPTGASYARGINESGQIVGLTCTPVSYQHAFLYSAGLMVDLGSLGGTASEATAINSSSHVVGNSGLSGDVVSHAFLMATGPMQDLGTLGGSWSWAYGINDSDQVVGTSYYLPGNTSSHAYIYRDGVMMDLTPTFGCCSESRDINNAGHVVGRASFPSIGAHAFLYIEPDLKDLGTLGSDSTAWGMNNHDQVVGFSSTASGVHAFIYDNGVMTDLNDLLPEDSGWVVNYATGINDKGFIVGAGTIGGQSHAFLMTPLLPNMSFTPVTPCRRVDTRVAVGALPPRAARNYWASDPVRIGQAGGNAAGCGVPVGPEALALTITAVLPQQVGNLIAYPAGTDPPLASALNFLGGQIIANTTIVPIASRAAENFALFNNSDGTTHVVVDVVGYFWEYAAGDCGKITQSQSIPASTSAAVMAGCGGGYVATGGGCSTDTAGAISWLDRRNTGDGLGYNCTAFNGSGTSVTVTTDALCCRKAGR